MSRLIHWLVCVALVASSTLASAQQTCDAGNPERKPGRFDDNGDGTVTDTRSRLMWMRCARGQHWHAGACAGQAERLTWQSARQAAVDVNRRAEMFYNDWRVPQIHELATIAELRCVNPRVDLSVFPGTLADWYWTASVRPSSSDEGLALSFGAEGFRRGAMTEAVYVRLVRSAL